MTDLSCLPSVSAIYHVVHQGRVVYVGKTKNLKRRWQNHHIRHRLDALYGDQWSVTWMEVTESNLDRAKAFAYREFQPELNIQNPSAHLGHTVA